MAVKAVRGMNDILPSEVKNWRYLEEASRRLLEAYGYSEIRTPIVEDTSLFTRSVGRATDIVSKEMYSFSDSKGRNLSLRPEETAPVIRAYVEHSLNKKFGFSKFYYIGPMFRRERPQAGRSRQFHQIGTEAIGSYSPYLDCETIILLVDIFSALKLTGCLIRLNSVGCKDCRVKFKKVLRNTLSRHINLLCRDCQRKLTTNVFRILDCKKQGCQMVIRRMPIILDYLCGECGGHFEKVKQILNEAGISYQIDPYLVRGLDYYTKTVFELVHPSLGSQNALAAGGRYDSLVNELGGPSLGACGMSIGMERVLMVLMSLNKKMPALKEESVYLVTIGEKAYREGYKILRDLRKQNIRTHIDYEEKSIKSQLRRAGSLGCRYVVILGENELEKEVAILKEMKTGKQIEVKLDSLVKEIAVKVRKLLNC